jgi:hypothetical protein
MANGSIDHARFISLLTEQFPVVAAEMDDCRRGLLHCEMGAFSHATQTAIDAGDDESVRQHFLFIDGIFRDATPDVENAVYVSYLENLRFEGRKAGPTNARELLPPRLQQALAEVEAYWAGRPPTNT